MRRTVPFPEEKQAHRMVAIAGSQITARRDTLSSDTGLPLNARMNASNPELWFAAFTDGGIPPALLAKIEFPSKLP
jgi:hypothetical protein